jgi:hypothetical protein
MRCVEKRDRGLIKRRKTCKKDLGLYNYSIQVNSTDAFGSLSVAESTEGMRLEQK